MARQQPTRQGLLLGDAARAIGVSTDTLRRWERAGKLHTDRDAANRRRVPPAEVERVSGRPHRHAAGDGLSDPEARAQWERALRLLAERWTYLWD